MGATAKDVMERQAMTAVSKALAELNDALRAAMAQKVRVEFGTVERPSSYGDQKVARGWAQLWTKDGLAVRFTREEIATAAEPEPPVKDGEPQIGGDHA